MNAPMLLLSLALFLLAGDPSPVAPANVPYDDLRSEGLARLRLQDAAGAEPVLEAALAKAPDVPAERAKARLLLAVAKDALGRPAQALEVLAGLGADDAPADLKDLVAFERARATFLASDPGAAAALRAFVADFPTSRHVPPARLMLARAALAAGDRAEATSVAQAVLDGRPAKGERAEATLILARAGDDDRRGERLRKVFIEMPDTMAAAEAGLTEADLSHDELHRRAAAFHTAMEYEEAQRIREALRAAGDRTPRLFYDLALSHLVDVRDDPRLALKYLDLAERGGAVARIDALYLRARAYAKLDDYDRAIALYRDALRAGVKGERRVQALYYIGWLPYDKGRYADALPGLDAFLKAVRKDELRNYVIWAKGWSLYRLKRWKDALKVFDQMEDLGNCLVAGKAMYWGGLAWRALGDPGRADASLRKLVATYPLTWYAVLAAKRLKEWHGTPLPDWMTGPEVGTPRPAPSWPFDELPPALAADLRRVKDLADVGEDVRARELWAPLQKKVEAHVHGEARARMMLTVDDAIEDYHDLFERGQGEFARDLGQVPTPANALYWRLFYPEAHRSLARIAAARFDLPEHWVYSIMRQESRYQPRQISYTAALGIMQMIPKTAKIVGRAIGVPFQIETFFQPGRNVLFCTYYLAELLRDFKGQVVFASAAYNAGAPAIKRFLARHRGLPLDEMVEHISYNESRNYCRKVAEHLIRYAYLHLPPAERAKLYGMIFPDKVDYDVGTAVDY